MFLSALSRIFCTTPAGAATGPAITEQPALEGTSADHLVQPPAGQDHPEITPQKYSGPRPGGRRGIFTHSGGGGAGSEAHRSSELQQRLAQGPAL